MYNYTIEIQAWKSLIGSGEPEITKIPHTSLTQLWGADLKPLAIEGEAQIFNMVIGETHNPSVGEFCTVYTYPTPKETTQ